MNTTPNKDSLDNNSAHLPTIVNLKKNSILCAEGDKEYDLYMITQGKLLVFITKGSEIIPLAYLNPPEFLGELSYFDKRPRSANIIALEDSILFKVAASEIEKFFPRWLYQLSTFMATKVRLLDDVIRTRGLKKRKTTESISPLSMKEQAHFYNLIKERKK
ncbi:MAG: cyclic nucleotide-binding domain-containing protein [Oligoflexia bacterium]|nr:cyclic nucleotide-binding domain-containing protein [Oligoflexia bacterium]